MVVTVPLSQPHLHAAPRARHPRDQDSAASIRSSDVPSSSWSPGARGTSSQAVSVSCSPPRTSTEPLVEARSVAQAWPPASRIARCVLDTAASSRDSVPATCSPVRPAGERPSRVSPSVVTVRPSGRTARSGEIAAVLAVVAVGRSETLRVAAHSSSSGSAAVLGSCAGAAGSCAAGAPAGAPGPCGTAVGTLCTGGGPGTAGGGSSGFAGGGPAGTCSGCQVSAVSGGSCAPGTPVRPQQGQLFPSQQP